MNYLLQICDLWECQLKENTAAAAPFEPIQLKGRLEDMWELDETTGRKERGMHMEPLNKRKKQHKGCLGWHKNHHRLRKGQTNQTTFSSAAELGEPIPQIFNFIKQLGRVLTLLKTSCIIPAPKMNWPGELNDFRLVALTWHVMKTFRPLFLSHLRPQVQHIQDGLVRPGVGVEDAILFLLQQALSHLNKTSGTVRILFLDFSSAINTIKPRDKLSQMQVDPCMVASITDYIKDRPQYVRLKDIVFDTVYSSTRAPRGTVVWDFLLAYAPFLWPLMTPASPPL